MLINNVKIINNSYSSAQIKIDGSKIIEVNNSNFDAKKNNEDLSFDFDEAIAFPGLINSHDHLEFNLFPKLGDRIYNDYVDWGNDINIKNKEQINIIKQVPKDLSLRWGIYKNLICGVTTIVNHGKKIVTYFENLPDVFTEYHFLHSIRIEKHWKLKLLLKSPKWPFLIHIGEGKNQESFDEINKLIKYNFLNKELIGIHAISMNAKQSKKFKAIIWCPDSNLFLYNKTANISEIKKYTSILFGTDSTLSANWNIWNHLRLARQFDYLNDKELYYSLTENASYIWDFKLKGKIEKNMIADIVICKKKFTDIWESFYNINPEDILLIVKNGRCIFIDSVLTTQQQNFDKNKFDIIYINSIKKYVIKGIHELIKSIHKIHPEYQFPISI